MSHRGDARTTAHAQAAPAPLELLSLRHERQGVNLSVAGLVRNPPAGVALERVTAVVYLFDQQGAFVTSAKAPIDFLKLTGGDESPFVVKIAAPTVGRPLSCELPDRGRDAGARGSARRASGDGAGCADAK